MNKAYNNTRLEQSICERLALWGFLSLCCCSCTLSWGSDEICCISWKLLCKVVGHQPWLSAGNLVLLLHYVKVHRGSRCLVLHKEEGNKPYLSHDCLIITPIRTLSKIRSKDQNACRDLNNANSRCHINMSTNQSLSSLQNNVDSGPPPAPPLQKALASPLANMFNQEPRFPLLSSSDQSSGNDACFKLHLPHVTLVCWIRAKGGQK